MRTAVKFIGWTLAVSLVVSVLLVVVGSALLSPLEHATIHIDDDSFTLGALHGSDWLFATGGMLLALLVVVLVVPVTVIVPLLAVALALMAVVAIGLAAMVGVAMLALSPLLLIGWVIWRLARPKRRAPARQDASIAA